MVRVTMVRVTMVRVTMVMVTMVRVYPYEGSINGFHSYRLACLKIALI